MSQATTPNQPNHDRGDQAVPLEGPRPPRLDEREELLALINFIFRTDKGRAPTIGRDWAHVYTPENLANVSVLRDPVAGKLVASTGVWASDVIVGDAQVRVGGINTVGTLPAYRGRGLGSQVVLAAHQTMRDLGCLVGLLSTGIADWYRRMGWEEAGTVRTYPLDTTHSAALPALEPGQRLRLVALTDEDVASDGDTARLLTEVLRIYHAARLGAKRTLDELRHLLYARQIRQIALAESDSGLQAYLFLQDDAIVEWAGPPQTVAALVRAGLAQRAAPLTLQTPGWAHPLVALLDGAGIPHASRYMGMLYLVDPQAVLDAYGVTSLRVEPIDTGPTGTGPKQTGLEGEQFRLIDVTGATPPRTLDRRALTRLFFGPPDPSEAAAPFSAVLPLRFWQWYLEKV